MLCKCSVFSANGLPIKNTTKKNKLAKVRLMAKVDSLLFVFAKTPSDILMNQCLVGSHQVYPVFLLDWTVYNSAEEQPKKIPVRKNVNIF